jgi:hypothetical protein
LFLHQLKVVLAQQLSLIRRPDAPIRGEISGLSGRLRFLRSRNKAYWIFIAGEAAGTHDDDARCTLASYADAADDETFRRAAQRHLTKAPASERALSSE